MSRKTIGLPSPDSPYFLLTIKELVEMREGLRGTPGDAFVTRLEMHDIIKKLKEEIIDELTR